MLTNPSQTHILNTCVFRGYVRIHIRGSDVHVNDAVDHGASGMPSTTVHPALQPAKEVPEEVVLDVRGHLPQELRGTLYRNGPARWEAGGFVAQHAFDGDALFRRYVTTIVKGVETR
jgi:hypothetical protein